MDLRTTTRFTALVGSPDEKFFSLRHRYQSSNPTIDNGKTRVDELEKCGFYKHWQTDFQLVEDLGIRFLRYGPPIFKTWLGVGKYDWEFCDLTFADLRRRN